MCGLFNVVLEDSCENLKETPKKKANMENYLRLLNVMQTKMLLINLFKNFFFLQDMNKYKSFLSQVVFKVAILLRS